MSERKADYLRTEALALPDPDLIPVRCEGCGGDTHESGAPLLRGNAWSIHAYIALTGGEPHPGAGNLAGGPNECGCPVVQHFGCSLACAIAAHQRCLSGHILPMVEAKREAIKQAHLDRFAAQQATQE